MEGVVHRRRLSFATSPFASWRKGRLTASAPQLCSKHGLWDVNFPWPMLLVLQLLLYRKHFKERALFQPLMSSLREPLTCVQKICGTPKWNPAMTGVSPKYLRFRRILSHFAEFVTISPKTNFLFRRKIVHFADF